MEAERGEALGILTAAPTAMVCFQAKEDGYNEIKFVLGDAALRLIELVGNGVSIIIQNGKHQFTVTDPSVDDEEKQGFPVSAFIEADPDVCLHVRWRSEPFTCDELPRSHSCNIYVAGIEHHGLVIEANNDLRLRPVNVTPINIPLAAAALT